MPTYDYECGACKHNWDEFQSMSAKPTKKCPKCGKAKPERQAADVAVDGSSSRGTGSAASPGHPGRMDAARLQRNFERASVARQEPAHRFEGRARTVSLGSPRNGAPRSRAMVSGGVSSLHWASHRTPPFDRRREGFRQRTPTCRRSRSAPSSARRSGARSSQSRDTG